ncbi:MAG: tail fiber domain-containing protein [Saprospiraceae bacterium]|nr:tail fiber domain-containing protein [Saprospiraceae bacterium]
MNILFGADASLGSDGYLLVGPKAGANVVLDNNEIMARNNGKTSSLFLQHDGGNLVILQKGIGKGGVGIGLSNPSHILHVNGVARSFQSTWATSSDRRVKNDVSSIQNAMSIVSKLRPVTFKWDATYRPSDTLIHHGFIAQEVEETMPTWTQQVEEKVGEELIDDFRTLNTSDLVPILTRAIQEQQEVILEQKSIMQVMQSQIDELTADITTLMTSLNPEK